MSNGAMVRRQSAEVELMPRSLAVAEKGVRFLSDLAAVGCEMLIDVLSGRLDPRVATAATGVIRVVTTQTALRVRYGQVYEDRGGSRDVAVFPQDDPVVICLPEGNDIAGASEDDRIAALEANQAAMMRDIRSIAAAMNRIADAPIAPKG